MRPVYNTTQHSQSTSPQALAGLDTEGDCYATGAHQYTSTVNITPLTTTLSPTCVESNTAIRPPYVHYIGLKLDPAIILVVLGG